MGFFFYLRLRSRRSARLITSEAAAKATSGLRTLTTTEA